MRARRREINIFNMSLLDILCGALGAFCFMMLVALPYYKPSGNVQQAREDREKTDQLLRDIEKLKDQLNNPGAAEDLESLLRQLQAQIQSLQGQVNQLTAENEHLKEKNDLQERMLAQKKPLLTVVTSSPEDQAVDAYLQDDINAAGGGPSANPPFDPSVRRHYSRWKDDQMAYLEHRGVTMWVSGDTPATKHFKVYVQLANEPNGRAVSTVNTSFFGNIGEKGVFSAPSVTLTPERFWTLVGTLSVGAGNNLTFQEATGAERDAEWKAIAKTAPPPIVTPAPQGAATIPPKPSGTISRDLMQRERGRQLQPTPAPSAKP